MIIIQENVSLQPYNTFRIDARCRYFTEIGSTEDFLSLLGSPVYQTNARLIVGGGSNLLFTGDFNGLVIKNNLKGIVLVSEDTDYAVVKAAAGENWHELVLYCIDNNLSGLENLSLIPGCVGASPMQNIGAYGVEIKETFEELEAFSLVTGEKKIFKKHDCEFGYRESVFKKKYKDQFLITSVSFRLNKKPALNTTYGAIEQELQSMHITTPTIKDVSNAVIRIRRSKLPDPNVTGNAGSFFKNPEVSENKYLDLKQRFNDLVAYPLANGDYKLAAGWLIEQCGLKGFELNGAAVHAKQALVLINKNNASGRAIYELSGYVLQKVIDKFGVTLEREVNII
ncbi:MAG TPA: UDP-N-acetylmuramate dehydrogenase [Bacteroidia bacterium]|nr:UDP-N-acetylmuramate dehydrogenase [Bacteroidia bacterium]